MRKYHPNYIGREREVVGEIKSVAPNGYKITIKGLQMALYSLGYEIQKEKKTIVISYYYGAMRSGEIFKHLSKVKKEIKTFFE